MKPGPDPTPLAERFLECFDEGPPDECWEWKRSLDGRGYGQINGGPPGGMVRAHRVSYEYYKGPIPKGMEVCHSCDNKKCVNPNHLWVGTHAENMADMREKGYFEAAKGSRVHTAKFTEKDIPEIRALERSGMSCRAVARMYGVDHKTIAKIWKRETWSHVP